jgi:cAMP-dependent protein kinase regulator
LLDLLPYLFTSLKQETTLDAQPNITRHFAYILTIKELRRNKSTYHSNKNIFKMSTFPGRFGAGTNPFGNNDTSTAGGASGFIHKVVEEDESDQLTSPTTPSFGASSDGTAFGASFGNVGSAGGPPSSWRAGDGFPSNYGMGRRTSVSAESLNPAVSSNDNWTPPFHKKTPEQLERLKTAVLSNLLFNKLDDEQSSQVLGALVEKAIPAKDIKVC